MSFRMAAKQAKKSPHKQHKLGAVIVKGSRILAVGYNSLRPSSLLGTHTLHAEAAAVLKLLKARRLSDLAGAEMYVTRFTRGGAVGIARPCHDCQRLLASVGIRSVHYSTDTSHVETMKFD